MALSLTSEITQLIYLRKRQSSLGAKPSVVRGTMAFLKGVTDAKPAGACKHDAGCALAAWTPGVNAGGCAARKRWFPGYFKNGIVS